MGLNLADRHAVRKLVVDRCTLAAANYALYLLGNVEATEDQKTWARGAIREPQTIGDQVSWHLVNNDDFITHGSGIDDETLKTVVELAIDNHFIVSA